MHTLTRVIPVLRGLLFAAIVQASPTVDQQHTPSGNFPAFTVARDSTQIQTFTVGITGTLTRIDVQVSRESQTVEDLVLSLWSTDATGLPQARLATASVSPTDPAFTIPGPGESARPLIPFDLTAEAVEVTAGELLAIVLSSNAANDPPFFDERYLWEIGEQYDRGMAYSSSIFAQGDDFHFRTFVTAPVTPFAAFTAKLELELGPRRDDAFELQSTFTLGTSSNGIDLSKDDVTLELKHGTASFITSIPAGSFKQDKKGRFEFEGTINGVSLEATITPRGNNAYKFKAEGKHADLTGIAKSVTVTLTIGNDSGSTTVRAKIDHNNGDHGDGEDRQH
jgi:hypothetical protein